MAKLLRGVRAEWLSFDGENWTLLGKDMEDYSVDLNPDTETIKNILGESSFSHKGFTPSASIEYMARTEDAIYQELEEIVNTLSADDAKISATVIRATLNEEVKESDVKKLTGTGYQVNVSVVPTSEGGSTEGYAIAFEYHENGARTQGTVEVTDRVPTFTPVSGL